MERREFLTVMAATAAAPLAAGAERRPAGDPAKLERPKETKRGDMLYRQLGRTGEEASVIGDVFVAMAKNNGVVACVTDGMVRDIAGHFRKACLWQHFQWQ